MKTAHILTTEKLKDEWLDEVEEITGLKLTVELTKEMIPPVYKAAWGQTWGDFSWLRSKIKDKTNARVFVTTKDKLYKQGIKGHYGMYDLLDRDGIPDFYIGYPTQESLRQVGNGFKSPFAWIFVHEYMHGREDGSGQKDRTHAMEEQGKLKELANEYRLKDIAKAKELQSTIQMLIKKITALLTMVQRPHPRFDTEYPISQGYGEKNPIYTQTGRHIGIDYACPEGTPIKAPVDGEICAYGYSKTMGNYAYFRYHYNGMEFVDRYMHLKDRVANKLVLRGGTIGLTGNTGLSTGPHLHVDTFYDEVRLDLINKDNWNALTTNPEHLYI